MLFLGPPDPFTVHFEQDLDEDVEPHLREGNPMPPKKMSVSGVILHA